MRGGSLNCSLLSLGSVAIGFVLVAGPRPVAQAADEPTVRVRIADGGIVSFRPVAEEQWREIGTLASDDPKVQDATLTRLLEEYRMATFGHSLRDVEGNSKVRLVLEPVASTPWRHVQWAMQGATDPAVKVHLLRFLRPDGKASIDQALPLDRGILPQPDEGAPKTLQLALFRMDAEVPENAHTKIKSAGVELQLPSKSSLAAGADEASEREKVFAALTQKLGELRGDAKDAIGEIGAPPPKGGAVPYADVFGVMGAMRAAGLERIQFQGAAAPLPRGAK